MSIPRELVAVGLDQERLSIAAAVLSGGKVTVKAWHTAAAPKGLDVRNGEAVGGWLKGELSRAGLGKTKLLFAAPRGEVVIKRLRLPRPEGGGAADLAEMVRLQMARQLTLQLEGTAIDFLTIEGGASEGTEGAAAKDHGVGVLAAALPGDRIDWYRRVAKAAGCKLERIGLASSGVASMLSGVSQRRSGPILGIAVGAGSVEFVILEHGHLVFARSAEIGTAQPPPPATGIPASCRRSRSRRSGRG